MNKESYLKIKLIRDSHMWCESGGGIYNPCWADEDNICRRIDDQLYKEIRNLLVKRSKELAGDKLTSLLKSGVFYI